MKKSKTPSMKGIILAGGRGSRLFPITMGVNKQLLPIYNKPTIYYPLSILMLANIKEILIISSNEDLPGINKLLGTGEDFGVQIKYAIQESPKGIAEAFIIGEKFIGTSPVCLILGDNIFYGHNLSDKLEVTSSYGEGADIFTYQVHDPERYGVATFDKYNKVKTIEEKPKNPKSNWAVTGLYFFDNKVIKYAKQLKPSKRGELEIVDILKIYLKKNKLDAITLGRGFAWLDTGTFDSLLSSSQFIQTIEQRQGFQVACLEEISYNKKWITKKQLKKLASKYNNEYGRYLNKL